MGWGAHYLPGQWRGFLPVQATRFLHCSFPGNPDNRLCHLVGLDKVTGSLEQLLCTRQGAAPRGTEVIALKFLNNQSLSRSPEGTTGDGQDQALTLEFSSPGGGNLPPFRLYLSWEQ